MPPATRARTRSQTAGSLPPSTPVVRASAPAKKKSTKSKGSCAGKGRKHLKGEGQGRPGVTCPSQGYKK